MVDDTQLMMIPTSRSSTGALYNAIPSHQLLTMEDNDDDDDDLIEDFEHCVSLRRNGESGVN